MYLLSEDGGPLIPIRCNVRTQDSYRYDDVHNDLQAVTVRHLDYPTRVAAFELLLRGSLK